MEQHANFGQNKFVLEALTTTNQSCIIVAKTLLRYCPKVLRIL
jgi:hypothetical protein